MLGIQDYRWKRSQLTTTKTARFQILERIGSLELMRTKTVAGKLQNCKTENFLANPELCEQICCFQAKLGLFDPFRPPPDAAPISIVSLHSLPVLIWVLCHMIIWWSHETSGTTCSYIEISPREQRFSILSC